jgi:hypothetical protein
MKTIADPDVLRSLIERVRELRPENARRWGTLTAHEMLCHLGDATEMVLRIRPRRNNVTMRHRPVFKGLWLWSAVRFPHGVKTNPSHDPKVDGTRPGVFEADRERLIARLEAIATAAPGTLEPVHGLFGTMSLQDWQRWAYKHTDHHLRQFGL